MSKIILRGKQADTLLWALDIAVGSLYTQNPDLEDAEWKADRAKMETLQASIFKQLGVEIDTDADAKQSRMFDAGYVGVV